MVKLQLKTVTKILKLPSIKEKFSIKDNLVSALDKKREGVWNGYEKVGEIGFKLKMDDLDWR